MYVSVEISYYPLGGEVDGPVERFIDRLDGKRFDVVPGVMSTVLSGEFEAIMGHLSEAMGDLLERHPSVFTLKVSNSCPV